MTQFRQTILTRIAHYVIAALLLLYAAAIAIKMANDPESFQFSFRLYYTAAEAFSQGLNPFDTEVLSELAGRPMVQPYVYAPVTLHLLVPLTSFDYITAYRLYFAGKIFALGLLLWLWHRYFLQTGPDALFLLLCLVGFNYAIYWDLAAGNISIFEQLLLWAAFLAFLRNRLLTAAMLIAVTASLKLTLVAFLVLLAFGTGPRRWPALAVGASLFVTFVGMTWFVYPDLSHAYIGNVSTVVTRTDTGVDQIYPYPATWPLLKTLFGTVVQKTQLTIPGAVPIAAYGCICLFVVGVSGLALRAFGKTASRERQVFLIMLACLVYVLVTPRLMYYSYIVALLPAYYAARHAGSLPALVLLLALSSISTDSTRPPGLRFLVELLAPYYPLILAYLAWGLLVWSVLAFGTTQSAGARPSEDADHDPLAKTS